MKNSISSTTNFAYSDYGDLLDFLDIVEKSGVSNGAIKKVRDASEVFIAANAVTPRYGKAKGLSIWLPSDSGTLQSFWKGYSALKFNTQTQWGKALQAILK